MNKMKVWALVIISVVVAIGCDGCDDTYGITKTVTASFPGLSNSNFPNQTVNFAASYNPAIAGGGFENDDVVYTVTDNSNPVNTWNSTTGYVINASPYVPNDVTFMLTFKYKDGTVISSKQITASTITLGGRFSGVSENPSIVLYLKK
jgi:hypothetical protein